MTFKNLFLTFFFLSASLIAADDEIRVQLATRSPLVPLYLGKVQQSDASFDPAYLDELTSVLQFDLNYNGSSKVLARAEEKEALLKNKESGAAFNPQTWRSFSAAYVVKATIAGKELSVSIFSTQSCTLKHFRNVPLTGSLAKDRTQLHKVADTIHKAVFDKNGVASTRLLYSMQQQSSWVAEIWEADWDGHNARQVTKENSYCVTPVFLPRSNHFANDRYLYVSYKKGQPKIYISSVKESSGKRLLDLRGNQLLPAISPQRDKIAFICDAGGRTDLFLQEFNPETGKTGKPVQLFSYPRATQASPTFSPDGSRIAFVSDKDGSPRIYLIPATAGIKRANAVLLTKQNPESSCPAWSPDGTKLAYSAKTKGVRQIWIYDFAAHEERQVTDGPGNKENPSWAPDSLHLVFNSTDTASSELYMVNLNQPEALKITRGPGKKHYPTWGN